MASLFEKPSITLSAHGRHAVWLRSQPAEDTGVRTRWLPNFIILALLLSTLGSSQGKSKRNAKVAYFPGTVPNTDFRDVLIFDFQAPQNASSFANPFTCVIFNTWRGNIPLTQGLTCTATPGTGAGNSSTNSSAPVKAEAPVWLTSAKRAPVTGQSWRVEAFNVAWNLSFDKPEADGFTGKASIVENRSGDQLPSDWNFRLVYLGRTVRLEVSVGQAVISCLLDDQYQNAVNGVLQGQADLFSRAKTGSQAQSPCRVVLK